MSEVNGATGEPRPSTLERLTAMGLVPTRRVAYLTRCDECGRVFDLIDATDAEEWEHGHDCEAIA